MRNPPIVLLALLLGLLLAQILSYLWVLITLATETGSVLLAAVASGLFSELVDILLHLLFLVPGAFLSVNSMFIEEARVLFLAANVILVLGLSAIGAKRFGTTPGLALTGRVLATRWRLRFPWAHAFIRQTLFLAWAILNTAALLGWLLVSPWLFAFDRKRRGVYDIAARTFPVLREEIQTAPDPSSTQGEKSSQEIPYPLASRALAGKMLDPMT